MTNRSNLSRRIRPNLVASLAALALTVSTPSLFASTSFFSAWQQQNFEVEFADEKLSVIGEGIPVKELLLKIQEATGIPVNFITTPTGTLSLNIEKESVESVIARISDNHMIIHDTVDGVKTIQELFIISETTEVANSVAASEFLPSGEPAPLVATTATTAAAAPTVAEVEEKEEKL